MPSDDLYDAWNTEKKALSRTASSPPLFKEREIWWCALGVNVGMEQNGDTASHEGRPPTFRRPVLVIKKLSHDRAVVLPLTTQGRDSTWFFEITVSGRRSWVLLNQIRMVSALRFSKRQAVLPEPEFLVVKAACRTVIGL